MSKRLNKCSECGGIYGHHMTGCPETPESPDTEVEVDSDDEELDRAKSEHRAHPRPFDTRS